MSVDEGFEVVRQKRLNVVELIELIHNRLSGGNIDLPSDPNLPKLYRAIGKLYTAIGQPEILADPQPVEEPEVEVHEETAPTLANLGLNDPKRIFPPEVLAQRAEDLAAMRGGGIKPAPPQTRIY
jgi:hypothetical protein